MATAARLSFGQVCDGFLFAAQARHLSRNTILDYKNSIDHFRSFLRSDRPIDQITARDIEQFLMSQDGLTNKTLLNRYIGISAVWTWAIKEGFAQKHVVHAVEAPRPEQREIVPYTFEEIKLMLGALARSRPYARAGQDTTDHALPLPERNRALILLLVDTGIRAEELCSAAIHQLDRRNSRLHVMGKGARERYVPFSPNTAKALWHYLATRGEAVTNGDPLFVTATGRAFTRHRVLHLLQTIGARANVADVTIHRFRHTCAIQYLRNGGDPYTLQKLLGHNTLEMVRRYLALAQIDLDKAHLRASPVGNWRL